MCKGPTASASSSSSLKDDDSTKSSLIKEQPILQYHPSGFERRKQLIEVGLLGLSVLYGSVYYWNPNLPASPEFCLDQPESTIINDDGSCRRPDLLAYKITSFFALSTMGLLGIYNWHFTPHMKLLALSESSPEARLFGYLPAAELQNVVMFCYQVWDFVVSLFIPEHCDAIFLIHHLLAMITSYCSLEYQMVTYYSIFYGGCSEFSSIFLIFAGEAIFVVEKTNESLRSFIFACQVLFFVTFSYYRIFGWIYYSFPLWSDCRSVLRRRSNNNTPLTSKTLTLKTSNSKSSSAQEHRPGNNAYYVLCMFLGLNVLLGALQCYWYSQIVGTIVAMFS